MEGEERVKGLNEILSSARNEMGSGCLSKEGRERGMKEDANLWRGDRERERDDIDGMAGLWKRERKGWNGNGK